MHAVPTTPRPDGERISDRRERVDWYFYD